MLSFISKLSLLCALPFLLTAEPINESCSQEILFSYFPKPFVEEVLKEHQVPKNEWSAITDELADKDKVVVKRMEEKAAQMEPNPIKDPKMHHEAVRIFRETLLEYFSAVMRKHGVEDNEQIQEMLDQIQQLKAQYFVECMTKIAPETATPETSKPDIPSSNFAPTKTTPADK